MHDLKFCQTILSALNERERALKKGAKIRAVTVRLSPLSHVTPKALAETFKVMAKETPFAEVQLVVEASQLGMKCDSCGHVFAVEKPTFACPKCAGSSLNITDSSEFSVLSVEVDKEGRGKS